MPVETAADRAALFSEDEFAEAALYTPPGGGAAQPCSIVYDRARLHMASGEAIIFELATNEGGARGVYAMQGAFILADQVPTVARGGRFDVAGDTLEVVGRPTLDETGKIWSCDLQKVPA